VLLAEQSSNEGNQETSAVITLPYSSKINGYLYHQRVSPPLKKMP
jgi:hypothetical protein